MTAVLGVNLCKAEDFRVGQRTAILLLQSVQVFYFLGTQGQSFLFVILFQILHMLDGLGLDVDGEDRLVDSVVHALQHGVVLGILVGHGEVFLDTLDAFQSHVLRNFHGIGRPRRHHFAARAHEEAIQVVGLSERCSAIKPAKFIDFLLIELMVGFRGNHALLGSLEKEYHSLLIFICFVFCMQRYSFLSRRQKEKAVLFRRRSKKRNGWETSVKKKRRHSRRTQICR